MLKALYPSLKNCQLLAILAAVTICFEVLFEVAIPYLMSDIIDLGIAKSDTSVIVRRGSLMLVMGACALVCGAVSARLAALAMAKFAQNLRAMLFGKVQSFAFANVEKFTVASLVTRLTTDVTNAQMAFQIVIRMLARSPMMFLAATLMAIQIEAELATVFYAVIPAMAIVLTVVAYLALPRFREMLTKLDKMNGMLQENFAGIRTVKAFVKERSCQDEFRDSVEQVRSTQNIAEMILAYEAPFSTLIMYATVTAVCWFGGQRVLLGYMPVGELVSFVSYVGQILLSVMTISFALVGLVISQASLNRITEVLNEVPTIRQPSNPIQQGGVQSGAIEFRDVCFSYSNNPDNLNIDHVSFKINSGETIGIIGETGSAKTTLVSLIPRFYEALSGQVLVDNQDVAQMDLEMLRSSVAFVLQKSVLFSGTIAANLRWGNPQASDEQLLEALDIAQAKDFVLGLSQGLETILGQGGVNLSGGQRQRLCIARALLKNPRILVLDDSSSALDTATDARLSSALKKQRNNLTTLIISQKMTSIQNADKVMVLEAGRLAHYDRPEVLHEIMACFAKNDRQTDCQAAPISQDEPSVEAVHAT